MARVTAGYGVLFDIDDTLVDFASSARLALLDVAASFGDDPANGDRLLRSWAAVSEREYQRFLAGELTFDNMLLARMTAVIAELDPDSHLGLDAVELELLRNESIFTHYRQYDDVAACLAGLRGAGVALGVVSNSDGDYQRRKMAAAGLEDLIDGAVFSGDLGVAKPEPAIFRTGAAAIGLPPERVVYVGDRWATDAVGALTAGLSAVWVNRDALPRPGTAAADLDAIPGVAGRLLEVAHLGELNAGRLGELVLGPTGRP